MTAKEYLSEIRELREKIRKLELRAEELQTAAEGLRAIRYDRIRVQTSVVDQMTEILAERAVIVVEMERERNVCEMKIRVREDQIARLDKKIYRDILTALYLDPNIRSLGDAARALHYEYTYLSKVHGEALAEFQERYMT